VLGPVFDAYFDLKDALVASDAKKGGERATGCLSSAVTVTDGWYGR
jgi:hypothetical protein